jgi:very-short-patch-repair endonuclease
VGVSLKQSPTADPNKRADPTYAEMKMWETLRKLRRPNVHFRRQCRVGSFTVDFVCRTARLVIEVDGGIHRIKQIEDARRQAIIEAAGYRVLRFTNEEAIKNPIGVRNCVLAALGESGVPHP